MTATRWLSVIALFAVVGVACGGSSTTTTAPRATETPATTQAPAPTVTTVAPATTAPPRVEITAFDYRYEGVPEVVPAGTTFFLINESLTEFHEAAIIRLDNDDQRTVEELTALSPGELLENTGTFQVALLSRPGQMQYAKSPGSATLRTPGRYLIVCSVPLGADPAVVERQVEFGPPAQIEGVPAHYQVTMFAEFFVEG